MSTERTSVKKEDFLDNDPSIRGQNYVCLSFVSPEDVIVKKEAYFFKQYIEHFSSDVKELFDNMATKFQEQPEIKDMFINLQDRYDFLFSAEKLQEDFDCYKAANSSALEQTYLEKNNYQTSMRGIKVRGVYETVAEAQKRAMVLKDIDGKFDVYVAEVGCWCPWSPNPNEIQDHEYAETELNTLVKKYKENLQNRAAFHKQRAEIMMDKVNKQRDQNDNVKELEQPDPWISSKEIKENVTDE
jgi:hypothetical protein